MEVLVECMRLLCYTGLWKTPDLSGWKSNLYDTYTIFVIFLIGGFAFTQLLDLLFISNTVDEMIDNIFTLVTVTVVCVKITGIITKNKDIERIRLRFVTDLLKPNTADEKLIQEKYNFITKITFFMTLGGYEGSVLVVTSGRIIAAKLNNTLPYRAYLPYDYSMPAIYNLSVAVQSFVLCFAIIIGSGFDSLFFGMMIQISAKINILKHQFQVAVAALEKMGSEGAYHSEQYRELEKRCLGDWICSHNAILSLCSYIESVFSKVIFIQYSVSSLILCSVIYRMSRMSIFTVEFLSCILYVASTGGEMFMMCFFSNQVTLNLSGLCQAMYSTNWFLFSVSAKKKIVLMMARTFKPVVFTTGHVVTLSLESFTALLKVVYSTYSLLVSM